MNATLRESIWTTWWWFPMPELCPVDGLMVKWKRVVRKWQKIKAINQMQLWNSTKMIILFFFLQFCSLPNHLKTFLSFFMFFWTNFPVNTVSLNTASTSLSFEDQWSSWFLERKTFTEYSKCNFLARSMICCIMNQTWGCNTHTDGSTH